MGAEYVIDALAQTFSSSVNSFKMAATVNLMPLIFCPGGYMLRFLIRQKYANANMVILHDFSWAKWLQNCMILRFCRGTRATSDLSVEFFALSVETHMIPWRLCCWTWPPTGYGSPSCRSLQVPDRIKTPVRPHAGSIALHQHCSEQCQADLLVWPLHTVGGGKPLGYTRPGGAVTATRCPALGARWLK